MGTNRKALVYAMGIVSAIGTIALAFVFLSSLKPSEKSLAELPHISLAGLSPGSFMYVPHPVRYSSSHYGLNILFLRNRESKLYAFYVPTHDGVTTVPTNLPWWSDLKCVNFKPNFDTSEISCMDNSPMSEYVTKHRWSLEGKNISRSATDLERVPGTEEHGYFVLFKHTHG